MKPGPKTKPTKLKQLEGDIHKERWNPNEPQPKVSRPRCPQNLSDEARKEWRRIVPELEALGLLTTIDRAALAAYCAAWGRFIEAEKVIKEKGSLYKTANGNVIISPMLSVANRAMEQMRVFGAEFGLTPSSRTRISATPQESDDPLDRLLGTTGRRN